MEPVRISVEEVKRRLEAGEPLAIVDARSADSWAGSDVQIPGSIRVPPDEASEAISRVPRGREAITYCT